MAALPSMTLELHARIVEALRTYGNVAAAARALKIEYAVVKRGWERGWKQLNLPPLKETIGSPAGLTPDQEARHRAEAEAAASKRLIEDAAAKAALEATAADAAREAKQVVAARAENRDAAVDVLEEERKLRKAGRAVAGQNLVASAKWGKAHQQLADELVRRVEREREAMTVEQLADLARTMALVDRTRMALLRDAAELERLHRGDPSVIVGVTPSEMTAEEAVKEIERANVALQRYKRRGLALIEGGAVEAAGPIIDVTPAQ